MEFIPILGEMKNQNGYRKVLCTSSSYARYTKAMEKITGFGMKDFFSLPGLGWNYFNSLRTKQDEPIYTFDDKYMRWFVRQCIKGRPVCAFNQNYNSKSCDDFSRILSEKVIVEGKNCDIIKAYLEKKTNIQKILRTIMKVNLTIIETSM